MLRIKQNGRMGNRMLQYILAKSLAAKVPGLEVVGFDLPQWNLCAPVPGKFPRLVVRMKDHTTDIDYAAKLLNAGIINYLELYGQGFRYENYLPREEYVGDFYRPDISVDGFGDGYLVCHIRTGDVITKARKDYGVIPFQYYSNLQKLTGKKLAFVGELTHNFYTDELRTTFKDAAFRSGSVIEDFETVRRSRHIALSTSTFAWLAAWLSPVAKTIHMPVLGFFDPRTRPDINLLPLDDSRYVFHQLNNVDRFGGASTPEFLNSAVDQREAHPEELQRLLDDARHTTRHRWDRMRRNLLIRGILHRAVPF